MSDKPKQKLRGLRKLANERDVKRAAMNVFNWVIRGEITPSQASSANGSLGVARAAIQTEVEREVIERLDKLEAQVTEGQPNAPAPGERVPLSVIEGRKA